MKKLIVNVDQQVAQLWDGQTLKKSYVVSTAKNGLSCEADTNCTPIGKLKVEEKIGDGKRLGTIFKSRIATDEVWDANSTDFADEYLVLTRILWLSGDEEQNQNAYGRFIYLHGTNHEDKLGQKESHGCIRFSNQDIIEDYEELEVGSEVLVHGDVKMT